MSCVAVATSPSFTPGHSPSVAAIVRHRDDPGAFRDVRASPSQLVVVSCLDFVAPPSSPLLYAAATNTPGRHCPSPFRNSSSTSSCSSSNINCKSSPCHSSSASLSMPPPSPKVQCSPRTTTPSSWTSSNSNVPVVPAPAGPSSITTATTRSTVCFCGGGLAISSSPCSCNLAASLSPGEPPATATAAWREKQQQRHSHHYSTEALAAGVSSVVAEPPSHSSSGLPSIAGGLFKRSSSIAMPPPPPSPRFGGPRSSFASPRAANSRPDSSFANASNVRKHLTVSLDECAQRPGDNYDTAAAAAPVGARAPAVPKFSISSKLRDDDKDDVDKLSANAHINVPQQQRARGGDGGVLSTVAPPLKRKRPPKLEIPLGVNQLPLKGSHGSLLPFKTADVGEDALDDMTVEGSYYAVACKKGRRETLEDTQRAVPNLHGDPQQAFFGVFDGHGGRKAADFAAEHLVERITEAMDSVKEGEEEAMTPEAATRAGYLATDADFLTKGIGSGACCVTATMKDGFMVVANAGDCRAVLSRAGTAEVLTCDHRAEREDERQRIEDAGGFVDDSTGTWRVQGILAVTRGIGDRDLKEWVSAEPEVRRLPITPDCEFLILASDGLWDAVSNQEALDTARSLLRAERVKPEAKAMDMQIPLAMASSSLSRRADDEHRSTSGLSIVPQQPLSSSNARTFGSVKDCDEEVDLCVGTLDADMPSVGFLEPGFPSSGPVAACRKLVEMSVSRGCRDDISVLIVNLAHFMKEEEGFSTRSG